MERGVIAKRPSVLKSAHPCSGCPCRNDSAGRVTEMVGAARKPQVYGNRYVR
jgi:hypothetical protein